MTGQKTVRAFTLIELLLVLVILAVLASIVVPTVANRVEMARRSGTIAEISNLKSALSHFEVDNSCYPSSSEGLLALVERPAGYENTWVGPYIEKFPIDKWGRPYVYEYPGQADPNSFDLKSLGHDGVNGTEDDIDKFTEH